MCICIGTDTDRAVFVNNISRPYSFLVLAIKYLLACIYIHAGKAMGEGNKWYYYSRRTQSRITASGYWQSIGVEEPIYSNSAQKVIGTKKYCAFYIGDPQLSQGVRTNWIMQEYKLSDSSSSSSRSSSRRRSSRNSNTIVSQCATKYVTSKEKTMILKFKLIQVTCTYECTSYNKTGSITSFCHVRYDMSGVHITC